MAIPNIPGTFPTLVDTNHSRRQVIREDRLDNLPEALNHIAAKRVNCLFNKSYMTRVAGAIVSKITDFNAAAQVDLCSKFCIKPRDKVVWLRWKTVGRNCTIQLRLDTDSALGSPKVFTHTHTTAGTPDLVASYIGVTYGDYWYGDLKLSGSSNAEPWSISLWELEPTGTQLSNRVVEYPDIATADSDLTPTANGPTIRVGDYLMSYYPGASVYSGAKGLWVPWDYRDAELVDAYQGGIAGGVGNNANWTDNTGGPTGAINLNPGSDMTDFDTSIAAADTAYIDNTPSSNFDPTLVYLKVRPVSGSNRLVSEFIIDNGVKRAYFTSTDGVVGDVDWGTLTSQSDYNIGTTATEFLIEIASDKDRVNIWLYNTMTLIQSARYSDVAATTAKLLQYGNANAAQLGQSELIGDPAMVVLRGRRD
jgi:hypothetical protein